MMHTMRIAMPNYWSPDSFTDNVSFTLRQMGHEVITPGWRTGRIHRLRARYEQLRGRSKPGYLGARERWLLRCVRDHRPDIVLALTASIDEGVLRDIKRLGVKRRIAWWGDPPANMAGQGLLTQEWDLVCLKDPDAVKKLRCVGINAVLVHEAMNPEWHKPIAKEANGSVVVAGNYYAYRQAIVKALHDRGVKLALFGPSMPLWATPEIKSLHSGQYIVKLEKSRVFGEALACLNSTSMAEGNSLNCRAFEIAGTGGLQLIENKPIVSACFEPGAEVLTYDTVDDIVGHLERANADPDRAKRVRSAGARRAHAEHTYRHRLEAIFADAGA